MKVTLPLDEDEQMPAMGLGAKILLAYAASDGDEMSRLIDADLAAAFAALITLSSGLAATMYGDDFRDSLHFIATTADLDAIGREVTG